MSRYKARDRSGSLNAASVAQEMMPANASRVGAWVQNNSVYDLWINELGTAEPNPPSMKLAPGNLYEFHNEGVPMTAISVYGQSKGQAWSAREW